jgi:hypothetical protein
MIVISILVDITGPDSHFVLKDHIGALSCTLYLNTLDQDTTFINLWQLSLTLYNRLASSDWLVKVTSSYVRYAMLALAF